MDYTFPERSADTTAHPTDTATGGHHAAPAARNGARYNLAETPPVTSAEWDHLRYRVVALENLLIALLADGPLPRLDRMREMASYVAPRRGCSDHPVSQFAAAQIVHLVERARHVKKHPLS